jgi:hypothetical protein
MTSKVEFGFGSILFCTISQVYDLPSRVAPGVVAACVGGAQMTEVSWRRYFSPEIFDEAIGAIDLIKAKADMDAMNPRQFRKLFIASYAVLYREQILREVARAEGDPSPTTMRPRVEPHELGIALTACALGRERGMGVSPRLTQRLRREILIICLISQTAVN